jgi:hypothetical protein
LHNFLAQPEPEGPTDEELLAAQDQAVASFPPIHPEAEPLSAVEYARELEIRKARAILARWGRPAIKPEGPTDEELRRRFLTWWREEASAMRPHPDHDHEEHARRISEIAWANGAHVARWGHFTQQGCTQLL